jgi:chromosome segregation ATPase
MFCFVSLVLCGTMSFAQAPAPTSLSTTDSNVLKALLSEVRQLRIALERATVSGHRTQIVLERLRIQQEQVNRVSRQADSVREELDHLRSARPRLETRLKALEEKFEAGVAPPQEVGDVKAELEQTNELSDRLREREIQLNGQLREERGKLDEIINLLDQLSRELQSVPDTETKIPPQRRR